MGNLHLVQGEFPVLARGGSRVSEGVVADVVPELGGPVTRQGIGLEEIIALGHAVIAFVAVHQGAALRLFFEVALRQIIPYRNGTVRQVLHEFLLQAAIFRQVIVDGADGIALPQRDIIVHVHLAALYLHPALYLGTIIADIAQVVLDAADALFHQRGVINHGRHAHALHEPAQFGLAFPAPVIHGQQRVYAEQV